MDLATPRAQLAGDLVEKSLQRLVSLKCSNCGQADSLLQSPVRTARTGVSPISRARLDWFGALKSMAVL